MVEQKRLSASLFKADITISKEMQSKQNLADEVQATKMALKDSKDVKTTLCLSYLKSKEKRQFRI